MNVKVETLEKNTSKIIVEVPAEEFDQATEAAYRRNKGRFNVPGFRKGHATRAMIEKLYGAGVFYEEAVNAVIDKTYSKAMEESGLDIVSRPEIDVEQFGKGQNLIYTAVVATKPPVEMGEYKGISVERAVSEVTEAEVEAELKRVQNQNARMLSMEEGYKIESGDIAKIDFEGFVDGAAFEGGKGEDYPLTIGSHSFIDGFEDQLIGHAIGEQVDVNVTFPENYGAENLSGKDALFKVTVKEVQKKELPELDDDFAAEVSEFDTLEEYKKSIRTELKARHDQAAAQQNENNVLKAVVDSAKVEIPGPMLEMTIDNMIADYKQRMAGQGLKFEDYLKYMGMDEAQYRENLRPQAENDIKVRLVLEEIVRRENITASEEALDEKLAQMGKNYKMEVEQIKKLLSPADLNGVRRDIACQEALDLIVAEAVLTEPAPKAEEEPAAAEGEASEE